MSALRTFWLRSVRWVAAYACGYAVAYSTVTGNGWMMLLWLAIPVGAILEIVIEEWP